MKKLSDAFRALVLAGERVGGNALSAHFHAPSSVMLEVAGKPLLTRVLETLRVTSTIGETWLSGPAANLVDQDPRVQQLIQQHKLTWLEPALSPASSVLAAVTKMGAPTNSALPILITTADHALLTPTMVQTFCAAASAQHTNSGTDFVAGIVPYSVVHAAYPQSKRTQLKFADGAYCGANLFALFTPRGLGLLNFWQQMENNRKRPWRMARTLGLGHLLRYVSGRLTLAAAGARIGALSQCQVAFCELAIAEAAIDVDSLADWELAQQILATPEADNRAADLQAPVE